jgi:hypothetical protein
MQNLKLIFLCTNPYYEAPEHFIKIYQENTPSELTIVKQEYNVVITKKIKGSSTNIKLLGIKNYSDYSKITQISEADSIIIFVDLENIESNQVLKEMIIYLKENCNYGNLSYLNTTKKIYILGKYQISSERDPSMTEENINSLLTSLKVSYDYIEVCTLETKQLVNTLDFIVSESSETKDSIMKSEKNDLNSESKVSSGSKCTIF